MSVVRRIRMIRDRRYPWWDWGHRVLLLAAREDGGSADGVPRPADLWFRREGDRLVATRDYSVVRERNDGEWRVFDSQNDGHDVVVGYWPAPGGDGRLRPSGLDGRLEQRLFLRWFVWDGWIKAEWFGLRRWIYYRALHAAVHEKVPFACQQVPPKGGGGYQHWHCQLRRRHAGVHRFRNFVWPTGGPVEFSEKSR